jgi:hypothetical protein
MKPTTVLSLLALLSASVLLGACANELDGSPVDESTGEGEPLASTTSELTYRAVPPVLHRWVQLPSLPERGVPLDIAAANSWQGLWAVSASGSVYWFVENEWHLWGAPFGPVQAIAMGPSGWPWVVRQDGYVFELTYNASLQTAIWSDRGFVPWGASDITVDKENRAWVVAKSTDGNGAVYRYGSGGGWYPQGGVGRNIATATEGDTAVYVVDGSNLMYELDGGYALLQGGAFDMGVGGDGSVWHVGAGIYWFRGSDRQWVSYALPPHAATLSLKRIAVTSAGYPVVVTDHGKIWQMY